MDISSTQDTGRTSGSETVAKTSSKKAGNITTDFDTFLKMMTTQLRNQDPLNPIDSADYAVQLATFSGVEQQTKTNRLLENIQTQFNVMGMAQLAGWVGKEARAPMPALVKNGERVTLYPNVDAGADRSVLMVKDKAGNVVNRIDLPKDVKEYEWDPKNIKGETLPDGSYTFSVENIREGADLPETKVELYGRITEVRAGTGGVVLLMEGGREISVMDVGGLRN